jgi:hypothetical protein
LSCRRGRRDRGRRRRLGRPGFLRGRDAFFWLVLDRSRLGALRFLLRNRILQGHAKLQLLLGFGGTSKLLVNRSVGPVQNDIRTGRIGVALENYISVGSDAEKTPQLCNQGCQKSR